jgi:hypothetical protein
MDQYLTVLVLGIDHLVQHNQYDDSTQSNLLTKYLDSICNTRNIVCIAEESSQMFLDEICYTTTVAKDVAINRTIPHLFLDPDRNERITLGIGKLRSDVAKELNIYKQDRNYSPEEKKKINEIMLPLDKIREEEWLRRIISTKLNGIILVLCGYEHTNNFISLLKTNNINNEYLGDFKNLKVNT